MYLDMLLLLVIPSLLLLLLLSMVAVNALLQIENENHGQDCYLDRPVTTPVTDSALHPREATARLLPFSSCAIS